MSYLVRFDDVLGRMVTDSIEQTAPAIWGGLQFERCFITVGNVAAYGKFIGQCASDFREDGYSHITFPTKNSFSVLKIRNDRTVYAPDLRKARGVLLHELGHHAVAMIHHLKMEPPWQGLKAGHSTHTRPEWCWIAATGWKYFYPDWNGTPGDIARMVRQKDEHIVDQLRSFEPTYQPPEITADTNARDCEHCGQSFTPKRRDARFCSDRCRVAANRRSKVIDTASINAIAV
jgi:hypothetical protein